MKVWKQFDADCSGYIEADELKQFVQALLTKRQGTKITEEKLIEYTDTIVNNRLFRYSSIFLLLLLCAREQDTATNDLFSFVH
jgi:hypothetical protein